MINVVIDGITAEVERGTTILHAAKNLGIAIPTLCNHEGLNLDGNCRLCSVEIDDRGRKKIVAACMFPITAPISVDTKSERVIKARKTVLQLLINRNPKAPIIKQYCNEYNVQYEERFASESDLCIRCGRCVRACDTNGTKAIELVGRGAERHVAPPYELEPEACIGCLSCASVCPTGKITYDESEGFRKIWHRTFNLVKCKRCGDWYATTEMLDWAKVPVEEREVCDRCRKYEEGQKFLKGDKIR